MGQENGRVGLVEGPPSSAPAATEVLITRRRGYDEIC
jgi:hypothetical protein